MNNILTLEQVIAETKAYFDDGNGNPLLKEVMLEHMRTRKEVPISVLTSLGLEKVTGYKHTGRNDRTNN